MCCVPRTQCCRGLGANPRAASPVGDPDRCTRIYFPPSAKRNAPPLGFQSLKGNRRPDAHPLRRNPGPAFPVWWGSHLKLCSWQLCQSVSCWPKDAHVEMHKRNTQSHSQPGTMMSALHTSPRLTLTSQIPRPLWEARSSSPQVARRSGPKLPSAPKLPQLQGLWPGPSTGSPF